MAAVSAEGLLRSESPSVSQLSRSFRRLEPDQNHVLSSGVFILENEKKKKNRRVPTSNQYGEVTQSESYREVQHTLRLSSCRSTVMSLFDTILVYASFCGSISESKPDDSRIPIVTRQSPFVSHRTKRSYVLLGPRWVLKSRPSDVRLVCTPIIVIWRVSEKLVRSEREFPLIKLAERKTTI